MDYKTATANHFGLMSHQRQWPKYCTCEACSLSQFTYTHSTEVIPQTEEQYYSLSQAHYEEARALMEAADRKQVIKNQENN